MGLVEGLMNPIGYLIPSTRKWDPLTTFAAPHFDKLIGTQSQQALDQQATQEAWSAWLGTKQPAQPQPQAPTQRESAPQERPKASSAPKRDDRRVLKSTSLMDDEDE